MKLLALIMVCMLPLMMLGQDTIVPGTFTVRKVYVGNVIPDGLGVFGNMGGVSTGGSPRDVKPGDNETGYVLVRGRAMTIMGTDSTPIRSATVQVMGSNVKDDTDEKGNFDLSLFPNFKAEGDSIDLHFTHLSGWDTTVTVPFTDPGYIEVSRRVAPPATTMSRKQRRREMLKRIFFPWMWFKKKEALPPRGKVAFGKLNDSNSFDRVQVLSQVGE